MGWVTDRKVGWWEWKFHNLRYRLLKLLVGRDCVVMNCDLCKDGVIGPPPKRGRLFIHNVMLWQDGKASNVETGLVAFSAGATEANPYPKWLASEWRER